MKTIYILDFFGLFNKEMAKALADDEILQPVNIKNFLREPERLAEILKKIKRNMGSVAVMFNLSNIRDINAAEKVVDAYMAQLGKPTGYHFFAYASELGQHDFKGVMTDILKVYFPILARTNSLISDKLPVDRIVVVSSNASVLEAARQYQLKTIMVESTNDEYLDLFAQKVELLSLSDEDEKIALNNDLVKAKIKVKDRRESAAQAVYKELAPLDKQEFIAACKLEMIGRWRNFVMALSKQEEYVPAQANADFQKAYKACVEDCIENYQVKLESREYIYVDSNFVKLDDAMRQKLWLDFSAEIEKVFDRYRRFEFQPNENFIGLINQIESAYQHQNKIWQELQDRKDRLNGEFVDQIETAKQGLAKIDAERQKVLSGDISNVRLEQYCREGNIQAINLYLQKNTPFYKSQNEILEKPVNSQGDSLLHLACFYGQLSLVKWLVEEKKVDIFLRNFEQYMIYHSVCYSKDLTTIAYVMNLFTAKQLSLKTSRGQTVLHLAEEKELNSVVKQLIEIHKVNPNLRDKKDETILHYAVRANDIDLVIWLLDSTVMYTRQRNIDGETALYLAFFNHQQGIIRYFKARGIWLATDEFDKLANYAKKNNKPEIVESLARYLREDIKALESIWGQPMTETATKSPSQTISTTQILAKTLSKDLSQYARVEDKLYEIELDEPVSSSVALKK